MSRATLLLALALLAGCPRPQGAARASYSGPPKAFKLLDEAPELETAQRKEKRSDLYVTTDTGDPIPSVVSTGNDVRWRIALSKFGIADGFAYQSPPPSY